MNLKSNLGAYLKTTFSVLIALAVCGVALWQKMEIATVTSLVVVTLLLYKRKVQEALEIGLELLRRTKSAKVWDVELTMAERLKDYSKLLEHQAEWVRLTLSDLNSEHISTLLAVNKVEKYQVAGAKVNNMRVLRDRGLLQHNAPELGRSTEVWLSPLGKDLASQILGADSVHSDSLLKDSTPTSNSEPGKVKS